LIQWIAVLGFYICSSYLLHMADKGHKILFVTPLVIDLNQDGEISLKSALSTNAVSFDLNNSGIKNVTGWIGKEDGLLVRDVNGDGYINSGRELFGSFSMSFRKERKDKKNFQNGFKALSQYDTDHNLKIDSNDMVFSELKIWQDLNENGLSEKNELFNLNAMKISSISLNYLTNDPKYSGLKYENESNEVRLVSKMKMDGRDTVIADVWLRQKRQMKIAGKYILPIDLYSQN
jgi:hypothetical protein